MSLNRILVEIAGEYHLENGLSFFDDFYNSKKKEDSGNLTCYFLELFPTLENEYLNKLKIASNLYFFSVLAVDKLIDEENSFDKEALLLAIALRERSLHKMYQIIEPDNEYWMCFEKYYKEYLHALSIEQNSHIGKITDFEILQLELQYAGNSALAKALPAAMAFKEGKESLMINVEMSIDYYYIGLNLYDDVNDWKQDWNNNNFSYLITKTIVNNDLDVSELNAEQLGRYVFFNNEAISCLELSLEYFVKAEKELEFVECEKWKTAIRNKSHSCKNLKDDIEMLVLRQLTISGVKNNNEANVLLPTIELNSISDTVGFIFKNGMKYILNQWKNGFLEVLIQSYFPGADNFTFNKRYYKGDVFQRAVIADIMFDLNIDYGNSLIPFLEFETDYLSSNERSSGGWNFYRDLEYQPNDSDTTAQVIQVLIKMDRKNQINQNTILAIDSILEQQLAENGRIRTWFLPALPEQQNTEEQKQYQFIRNYTGHNLDESIDLDVMANFLYALMLFDKEKYIDQIKNGIEFIENHQNEDGCWTSTWYWGDYYGTYVILKLLCKAKKNSKSILKAKNFLLKGNSQQKYWGCRKEIDDPLNTAFALISLHYLSSLNYEIPEQRIRDACDYLKCAIVNSDELKKCDFINLRKEKFSTFKSNSITIAYALKALSLWKKRN